ncbi:MAG: hypothetical protein [Caudoviricetes sp.]|nr:MAG: hypothetical protein [Caudoviricetes sp.]
MPVMTLQEFKELRAGKSDRGCLVADTDWMIMNVMTASQVDEDWGDGIWHLTCDHNAAMDKLETLLHSFRTRKKAWAKADIIHVLSSRPNFRASLADSYKGNRTGSRKPVGYWEFEQRCKELFPVTILEPKLEGDDVMGILGSDSKSYGYDKAVLVSVDKDFKTIPDCDFWHLTDGQIHSQTQETADWWWFYQTIIGDRTDGYSGIPSFGEQTANEFLDDPYVMRQRERIFKSGKRKGESAIEWYRDEAPEGYSVWDCMLTLAEYKGMTPDDLLLQARLARILRKDDYNTATGEIKLWEPTDGYETK